MTVDGLNKVQKVTKHSKGAKMGYDQLPWLFMCNGESLHTRMCAHSSCLAFVRGACMPHVVPAGAYAMLTPGLSGCDMYIAGHGSRMLPHVLVTHYASVSCIGYTLRRLLLRL